MNAIHRYALTGEPGVLTSVLQILATDPAAAVISVSNDDRAQVARIVVALDAARADALRSALGTRIQVTGPTGTDRAPEEPGGEVEDEELRFPPPGPVLPPMSLPDD